MAKQTAKGSHTNRKFGRDSVKCDKYRAEGWREKNKARKAAKQEALANRRREKALAAE